MELNRTETRKKNKRVETPQRTHPMQGENMAPFTGRPGKATDLVIDSIWQRLAIPRLDFGAQDEVRRAKSQAWGNCLLQRAPAPTTAHCNQRHHVMTTNLEYQEG